MNQRGPPPTAAERAAATIAAAAAAAAAEEAAEEQRDTSDECTLLLAAEAGRPRTGRVLDVPGGATPGERRARAQRSTSPAFMRPLAQATARASGDGYSPGEASLGAPSSAVGRAPSRACQWLRCLPVLFLMLLVLYIVVVYVAVSQRA